VPRFAAVRIAEASTETAVSMASEQPRAVGGRSGLIDISLGGGRRARVDASVDAAALARVRHQQGSFARVPKNTPSALIESIVEAHAKDVVALIEGAGQAACIGWI
jgi:hypothetical protein